MLKRPKLTACLVGLFLLAFNATVHSREFKQKNVYSQDSLGRLSRKIKRKVHSSFPQMRVEISARDIVNQVLVLKGLHNSAGILKTPKEYRKYLAGLKQFYTSIELAFKSFLNDGKEQESLLALIEEHVEVCFDDQEGCHRQKEFLLMDYNGNPLLEQINYIDVKSRSFSDYVSTMIRRYLNHGHTVFSLYPERAPGGEQIQGSWIFNIRMANFSDYGFFGIVSKKKDHRKRYPTHNYGWN